MEVTQVLDVPEWANITAIAVGSVQGALYAAGFKTKGLDLLGVAVIGIATGLGGGFLRDILLNRIPMAMTNNYFILVAVGAALLGMLLGRYLFKFDWLLSLLDALSLGLFGAIGTTAAMYNHLPVVPALFVGVVTAVGGGMIRDLLLNMKIAVLYVGSLYAVSALAGASALMIAYSLGLSIDLASALCVLVTTILRMLARRYGWSLPEQRMLSGIRNPKLLTPDEMTGPIGIA